MDNPNVEGELYGKVRADVVHEIQLFVSEDAIQEAFFLESVISGPVLVPVPWIALMSFLDESEVDEEE